MQIYDHALGRIRWKDIYFDKEVSKSDQQVYRLMEIYAKERAAKDPWYRVDKELRRAVDAAGAKIEVWKTEYDRHIHVALELGDARMTRKFFETDMEPDEVLADLLGTLEILQEHKDKYG